MSQQQQQPSLLDTMFEGEIKFQRACHQIKVLNKHMRELKVRYDRAKRDNHHSFRYSIRLRLSVIEGVRNMFCSYAESKAKEVTAIRLMLTHSNLQTVITNNNQASAAAEGGIIPVYRRLWSAVQAEHRRRRSRNSRRYAAVRSSPYESRIRQVEGSQVAIPTAGNNNPMESSNSVTYSDDTILASSNHHDDNVAEEEEEAEENDNDDDVDNDDYLPELVPEPQATDFTDSQDTPPGHSERAQDQLQRQRQRPRQPSDLTLTIGRFLRNAASLFHADR